MDLGTLKTITDNFINELDKASKGEKSSLYHIRNKIPSTPLVSVGEKLQAMAIGGTNFKSGHVKKTADGLVILEVNQKIQPPIFETKEDFLKFVAGNLLPDIEVLGINFAFPLEPVFNNKLEGKLLYSTKEHKFTGLIGENVCTEIEKYIQEKLGRKIMVSVANDTVCLLLSGKTKISGSNIAAGIVGTGLNFGFFEDETTLINTETGGFNKFPQSPEGLEIDSESIIKGVHLFEKEIAGAYLYRHFNIRARKQNLDVTPLKNSKQLTDLATKYECKLDCKLAQEVLKHSANLSACAIAGVTKYKKEDMHFVMVGSLFWRGDGYREFVEEALSKLIPEYKVKFIDIENSDLLGAAKLVA